MDVQKQCNQIFVDKGKLFIYSNNMVRDEKCGTGLIRKVMKLQYHERISASRIDQNALSSFLKPFKVRTHQFSLSKQKMRVLYHVGTPAAFGVVWAEHCSLLIG